MENKGNLIEWRDSFNTGYQRVDNQHKHLVKLINDLHHLQDTAGKSTKLDIVFTELYNYTINHFSMEETLMREFGYEEMDKHKEEHHQFVSKIIKLKDNYLNGDDTAKMNVLNFLKDWLLNHIFGTDKATFTAIKRKMP